MIEGKTVSKRRANIFASNLLSTFSKEMHQNELHSSRFLSFLGINDMTACLIVSGSEPEISDSS